LLASLFALAEDANAQTAQKSPFRTPVTLAGKMKNAFIITIPFKDGDKRFLLDTGAGISVFDSQSFKTYRVESHEDVMSVGGKATLDVFCVEFTLGHKHIRQQVFRSDLSDISKTIGMKIDGVLGQDILSHFESVTFDYRRRVMIFN